MNKTTFTLELDEAGLANAADFPNLKKYGLYVIRYRGQAIRIGECASGNSRLKKGFREPLRKVLRGKERKNYIAYHWRSNYARKKVSIDYYELEESIFSNAKFRRALEAELTFQFRLAVKKWPKEMSEIHFLESLRKKSAVTKAVKEVLGNYGHEYDEKA